MGLGLGKCLGAMFSTDPASRPRPRGTAAHSSGANGSGPSRSALAGADEQRLAGGGNSAPRTESELQQHIEHIPETVQLLNRAPPPADHNFVASMTTAATNAALQEAFRVLALPEHLAVVSNVVRTEAGVAAKQAVSKDGLEASRQTARAAFVGSYDAVEQKWQEAFHALPHCTAAVAVAGAAFLGAFTLGAFLALWRLVLFGLR